jgi:hypothetical protein
VSLRADKAGFDFDLSSGLYRLDLIQKPIAYSTCLKGKLDVDMGGVGIDINCHYCALHSLVMLDLTRRIGGSQDKY